MTCVFSLFHRIDFRGGRGGGGGRGRGRIFFA